MSSQANIQLPAKLAELFSEPLGAYRFRVMHGGRGSGKSRAMAIMALVWGYSKSLRILCTREVQASIKESMHAELRAVIEDNPWMQSHYKVLEQTIRGRNGTEFIFRGLHNDAKTIKSLSGVNLCLIEEGQDISQRSLDALLPTIREEGSEIWIAYNPENETDPVDAQFRQFKSDNIACVEVNYFDNPFFPSSLEEQRLLDYRNKTRDEYLWIWEGKYLKRSLNQVFVDKYESSVFVPATDWDGPYQGMDWGFANDPTTGIRAWINENKLFVEYDAGKVGLELDDTAKYLKNRIPDFHKYVTRADSARPESISHVNKHGLPRVVSCVKWPGSVEDGIQHIRSYDRIVIHPRCEETLREFDTYSYKTNKAGDILPAVEDANNHYIDALRYALGPLIKTKPTVKMAWA